MHWRFKRRCDYRRGGGVGMISEFFNEEFEKNH
jgi:hypothetical protein